MTYFQDDNGNQIEIDDDLQIYKSAVNLFDFTIKGNFSTSFQIPNNSFYKNAFQYFTPLQLPSKGFQATVFNLVKNGNVIERGQLILEREDDDYLYFFFVSGNSNWISLIPDISIRDIDYEDFKLTFSGTPYTDIYATRNATSGFCFPMVDWGLLGNKCKASTELISYYLNNYDTSKSFSPNDTLSNGFIFPEFYPCFFVKSALQEIFSYCQLKIGGDLLNDPVYNQMIMTPDSGLIERANKFYTDRKAVATNNSNSSFSTFPAAIVFDGLLENGALQCWQQPAAPPHGRYIANKKAMYNIYFSITLSVGIFALFRVYKNGSSVATYSPQSPFVGGSFIAFSDSANVQSSESNFPYISLALDTNDYLEFYMDFAGVNKGNFTPAGSFPGGSTVADHWRIAANGTCGGVNVFTGDIIQARKTGAGTGTASDWVVAHISSGINVLANSTVTVAPEKNPYQTPTMSTETLRASDILPDMKMIDFIKFVSNYFCVIPSYDNTTSTLSFNKLDNYDYLNAQDWSQFLQKLENNYQIQTAKYNYIRFNEVDDRYLKILGAGNDLKYGDILIQGQSSTKLVNELYKIPFGAAMDRIDKNGFLIPFIPLCDLENLGQPMAITSAQSNSVGFGAVAFNLPDTSDITSQDNILALIYATGIYDGYANGSFFSKGDPYTSYTTNQFTCNDINFTSTCKGYIQRVSFNFKSNQSRILFFAGEQQISYYNAQQNTVIWGGYGASQASTLIGIPFALSSTGYAYFSKPTTSYIISSFKQGLNLDYYQGGYNDIPRGLDYYKNLTRILNAPYVKGWFYLPETIYAAYKFDTFIFIKDEEQQRYYYVDSIENYKDSRTLVQVNMLLLP